jgi:hypothetical protein
MNEDSQLAEALTLAGAAVVVAVLNEIRHGL